MFTHSQLNLAGFNDFFEGEEDVLPACMTILRSYLTKIPGCGVLKDITDIAEVCLDKVSTRGEPEQSD